MTVIDAATTQQLQRIERLDAISLQARQVRPGLALVGFIAAVLIFAGKLAGWFINAFAWTYVAVREGYRDARSPERAPKRSGSTG